MCGLRHGSVEDKPALSLLRPQEEHTHGAPAAGGSRPQEVRAPPQGCRSAGARVPPQALAFRSSLNHLISFQTRSAVPPPRSAPIHQPVPPPLSLSLYTRWDPTCSHCGLKRKPWASNAKQSAATWPLHGVSIATGVFVLGRRPQTSVTLYFSK